MIRRVVIMGVAGSGKSSVGPPLATRFNAAYIDGDDLHPPSNVERMASGLPLDDECRRPWLLKIGETLREAEQCTIIACSALKRRYRDIIREAAGGEVLFVHLAGARELIGARMAARKDHFMPLDLLDSQFAALEPLHQDEAGGAVDIDRPIDAVVAAAADYIAAQSLRRGGDAAASA